MASASQHAAKTTDLTRCDATGEKLIFRKSVTRKTIDAATSVLNQRSAHAHRADAERDAEWLQARTEDVFRMEPPSSYPHLPATSICSRFVHSAVNVKAKTPIYQAAWTPDGRRVVAASQSGEFTLWSGSAFHFESILQAHECAVRTLCWSRSGNWLLAGVRVSAAACRGDWPDLIMGAEVVSPDSASRAATHACVVAATEGRRKR